MRAGLILDCDRVLGAKCWVLGAGCWVWGLLFPPRRTLHPAPSTLHPEQRLYKLETFSIIDVMRPGKDEKGHRPRGLR